MRLSLYFINWNDSFYLPFIKEHYGKFCQKIVMYDNHSTDNSVTLAKQLGFQVKTFGMRNHLNDQHYLDVKNHCWKEDRGKFDYVIVCDADEFLERPFNLTGSCPEITGYNMISDSLPDNSVFEIKTGAEDIQYSKQIIFDPNKVQEINYVHGCHQNHKTGEITPGTPLKLFHYRMIGGFDRLYQKHYQYQLRMSEFNKKYRMGHHYLVDANQKKVEWDYLQSKAVGLW
jgi:glycosyltransferase involved in cell wall biosynthesis